MTQIVLLILVLCQPGIMDWAETPISTVNNYRLYRNFHAKQEIWKWRGYPDPNYVWEGDMLVWEREVESGNEPVIIKTYKKPIEVIAKFNVNTKVYGIDKQGKIEGAVVDKFGGSLIGFIWLDNILGGGEVTLPFTAPHIFIATGDRFDPNLTEIYTDPNQDNYYETDPNQNSTHVYVKTFSGIGGAAGASPTLIAQYKMNDNAATAVVVDETGNHNGEYQLNSVAQNTSTGASTGKINGALDFVGGANGEHVEIADHDDFTPALTPFSISAYIYMHDATGFRIVSKGVPGVDGEWYSFTDSGGELYFACRDENATARIGRKYGTTLTGYENQWIHIALTYDGGTLSSGVGIYLNGSRIDDTDYEQGVFVAVENHAGNIWIGRYDTFYANGLIDNITIWSVELSPDEVKRLYNNNNGTEILAEIDSVISPRRSNTSPLGTRARYEFP